jgi:membrane protein
VLKAFSHYVQSVLLGGLIVAMSVYLIFDFAVIVLLFAMIFKFLPDAKIQWRDVWVGAVMTAILSVSANGCSVCIWAAALLGQRMVRPVR